LAGVDVLTGKPKSDLPVRVASALVMLAVLSVAIWLNDPYKMALIAVVGTVCFIEFVGLVFKATANPAFRLLGLAFGAAYIGSAVTAMIALPLQGFGAAIGVVIFTDVFAYFVGRAIGGPKIAPRISPSKTWAGLLGGMIGAAIFVAGLAYTHFSIGGYSLAEMVAELGGQIALMMALGAGLAVLAQGGDFFESWLKRKAGVKDSSKLIPGHGGVFDRIDGLLPVSILIGFLASAAGMI
jgi:phosphatidate cytidylyltransferase